MNYADDLKFAVELARGAGGIIREKYGRVERLTKTHSMTTDEAVTEADRASQRFIVQGLKKRYPTDGIVGEESETGASITFDCPNPNGRAWVIDPIDGTNNFIAGLGNFAVCIGLLHKGMPVVGVVYDVTRDQMYSAAQGEGAWQNNQRLAVPESAMNDASLLMLTANLIDKTGKCPQWAYNWMCQTNWKVRILGSAALEAIQVGAGVAHAAITMNGKLWDIAAAAAIVIEAGGVVVDFSGNPVFPYDLAQYTGAKVPFVAAAPEAVDQIIAQINSKN